MKSHFAILFFTFSTLIYAIPNSILTNDNNDPFIVVLDAGHGGHDPGNLGNGYLEKSIALNIVLKVGEILSANKDIKVIYTRKDDTFVDLFVRGQIANKANADLFVSVHCDSHSSDASGAGTFVLGLHANKQNFEIAKKENSVIYLEDNYETRYADYDINSPESIIGLTIMQEEFLDQSIALAKLVQDNLTGNLKRKDRKVKQAGFIVLHQTFMPSVLVESGFLTNKEEGAYLNSKKGQDDIGQAIATAILEYKETIQPSAATLSKPVGEKLNNTENVNKDPEITEVPDNDAVAGGEKSMEAMNGSAVERKDLGSEIKPVIKEKVTLAKAEKSTTDETQNTTAPTNANIVFKVQLLASSKDLALIPDNFNGLSQISKESFKSLYRYMYGETHSYDEIVKLQYNASLKGYDTAYVVAYKNGQRIPVKEALEQLSQ